MVLHGVGAVLSLQIKQQVDPNLVQIAEVRRAEVVAVLRREKFQLAARQALHSILGDARADLVSAESDEVEAVGEPWGSAASAYSHGQERILEQWLRSICPKYPQVVERADDDDVPCEVCGM